MSQPATSNSKPLSLRRDAEPIIAKLVAAGHVAYLAGGCVRDQLLGLAPKDFDVATDAPPERIRQLFSQTQSVGAAFGVVLVRMGNSVIEVATFRTDGAYVDGRRPDSVTFATPQEDAQRRDFTINGLFFDIQQQRVIDFVGGVEDLAARRLCAIGVAHDRFAEDHLRLLRAVRFAARFDLSIEPTTSSAIAALAPKLISVSPERIAEELRMMSAPPTRRRAWRLLREFGLDATLFRFAPQASRQAAWVEALDDASASLPLVMAAATIGRHDLSELSEPVISRYRSALRQALRWSNAEADAYTELLLWLLPVLRNAPLSLAQKRRWTAIVTFEDAQRLLLMIAATEGAPQLLTLSVELRSLAARPNPAPLISGNDLQSVGLRPGPSFRQWLHDAYDAQLENRLNTKEEALAYVQALNGPTAPASE